jgi:hypothetical protein
MVGERGPELMFTGGGAGIMNNAQSMALMKAVSAQPAQSPWQTVASQMNYGGDVITPGQISNPTGRGININFAANSVCVTIGNKNTSTHDSQSAGKAVAKSIVTHLERELLLSTIAQGIKG